MATSDWLKLIVLGAIWGGSFAFLKVLVPVLGAVPTASLRVLISGIVLFVYYFLSDIDLNLEKYFKSYLIMGVLHSTLPLMFFAFAALHIPAGLSAILNSTSPFFTTILAFVFLSERLTRYKIAGLILGTTGVALITLRGNMAFDEFSWLAIVAGLGAALCYAVGSLYLKKYSKLINPIAMTGVSQFLGGLILLPFAIWKLIEHPVVVSSITSSVIVSLLGISLICSALAFIIFYKLIARVGPAKAMTVGYLMPLFGMIWGTLFIGEKFEISILAGGAFILLGVKVATSQR